MAIEAGPKIDLAEMGRVFRQMLHRSGPCGGPSVCLICSGEEPVDDDLMATNDLTHRMARRVYGEED
jgi:hypothetical protein